MCKNRLMLRLALLIVIASCGGNLHAATVNATSCASSSVQTAINNANNGDTVVIPACSATTWASAVNISGKSITVQGATTCSGTPLSCTDKTNIVAAAGNALMLNTSTTNMVTVGGVTITMAVSNINNGAVTVSGDRINPSFRFHHSHIIAAASSNGLAFYGAYGLMDHVVVDFGGSTHAMIVHGDWSSGGFQSWNTPLSFGTAKSLYIEDSQFNGNGTIDGTIDGYTGGRIVVRYSRFVYSGSSSGDNVGFHGTDSGGYRSFMSAEIYDNTFINNSPNTMQAGRFRGGTGVWHDNTFAGSWGGIVLQLYRACPADIHGSWNACDGTQWKLDSIDPTTDLGRVTSTSGTAMWCSANPDTPCTSNAICNSLKSGDTCSRYFDGNGASGYACRDQVGTGYNQTPTPIYAWNNGPVGMGAYDSCDVSNWVQSGREYFNNTPKPGYTPYTYPHPMQGGSSVTNNNPPSAPSNLNAIVN
jgi:hypothetical protein